MELVHWIVEDRKAMDNLLRTISSMPSENRSSPTFNAELKVEEARYTLGKIDSNTRNRRGACKEIL